MSKPSPAQLKARALFAERARAGTLRKPARKTARASNPIKLQAARASDYRGKYPTRIKAVGTRKNPNTGGTEAWVELNDGRVFTGTARDFQGRMPKLGEDFRDYHLGKMTILPDGTVQQNPSKRKANPVSVAPVLVGIKVNAGNDRNGNPRRGWIMVEVMDGVEARQVGFVADDYRGSSAIAAEGYGPHATVGTFDISAADYKQLSKLGPRWIR